jgi:hypothetical protein
MIIWPKSLVREIAARRCVFFLGAGVSASATDKDGNRPRTWAEFLEEACRLIVVESKKRIVKKLVKEKNTFLHYKGSVMR